MTYTITSIGNYIIGANPMWLLFDLVGAEHVVLRNVKYGTEGIICKWEVVMTEESLTLLMLKAPQELSIEIS